MKRTFLLIAMVATQAAWAANPLLVTDRINANKVAAGLPLVSPETMKSDDGRKKQRWSIKGHEVGVLEFIGNNPSDADQLGMHCMTFDHRGNNTSPIPAQSPCHQLFVQVLGKFVKKPERFAAHLIAESLKAKGTATRSVDDFSFETDGEFYFVRRQSRMKTR